MVDSSRYEDWLKMAQKDLRGAKILFEAAGTEELVAFHCQQAVEKYLKAFLIKETGMLHGGHYLMGLLKKCYKINPDFEKFTNHIAYLNSFYIETRYPSSEGLVVEEEDAKKCIEYASEVLAYIF
ncbi:HEPN domain-containing protein [Geosporobacter subterraneus DSM 17957]|uniref:HEPN domain-containing protein n=1 Tax=Geosporobacter subterraneus DSM 17957 TaxID=1121919 RepID=A0A1M6CN56_9FIRM|nr:HEPN domain-containing protein [Geosporobacter subterraneus]SHI62420.1 HEPN domain-containing protein [Geosporobacter subterraneus DSM 17957]